MSKSTLNILTTVFGLIAGGSSVLSSAGVINHNLARTIGGIATALLGYLVQQRVRTTREKMRLCTNPLILIMGIPLLPTPYSLFPLNLDYSGSRLCEVHP